MKAQLSRKLQQLAEQTEKISGMVGYYSPSHGSDAEALARQAHYQRNLAQIFALQGELIEAMGDEE